MLEFGGVDPEEYNCSVEYPCVSLDFIIQSLFCKDMNIFVSSGNYLISPYNSNIDEINSFLCLVNISLTGNLEGSYIKYSDSVQSSDSFFTFSNNFNIHLSFLSFNLTNIGILNFVTIKNNDKDIYFADFIFENITVYIYSSF
jgi:hypothetical protein